MIKKLHLKSLLLIAALLVGSSSAWATDFTLSSANSVTKDGITISFAKGDGSTAPTWYDAGLRFYASNTITISVASGNIAAVSFNWEKQGSKAFASVTADPGTYSHPAAAGYGTWKGSSGGSTESVTFTLGSSGQLQLNTLSVFLEDSPAHTITASSNNNTYGTVSLIGSTIIATPASGYRVSTSTPYTVTSGTATVTPKGNVFSVNPSVDCAVQVNFESTSAVTLYTVTINAPENGTLSVKLKSDNSDVTSGTQYAAGTVLKITATPNEGYNFKNIQVVDASTHTYTASNTREYELTANNTTIKANFEAKEYHSVNWYVNGTISSTVSVEKGTAITKPATDPANIGGKRFLGWVDTPIVGTTDTKPTFFTTANMGSEDVNYYAVFATVDTEGPDTYAKITSSTLNTNETYVLGAAQSSTESTMWYFSSYAEYDKNTKWGVSTNTPATVSPLKLTLSGTASSLIVRDENGKYLVPWKDNFRMESASTNATISIDANGVLSGTSASTTTNPPTVNLRYNYNNGSGGFRWYDASTTGTQAYLYKIIPGTTYSAYCTTIAQTVEISSAGLATFAYDYALDYSGVTGLEAYIAKEESGAITLTKVNKVPAGTGVLLRATAGDTSFNVPVTSATTDNVTGNLFVRGTGAAVSYGEGPYNYVLSIVNNKIGFYKANNNTVATNRAYLQTTIAAGARIEIDGMTGISSVNLNENQNENRYYDLQGRYVAQPTKGLYIVNGRKVVIK